MNRKIRYILAILSLSVILAACGENEDELHVSEGMGAIERMEYEAALESFAQAEEAGENERLIKRGQGLAYMGLTRYEDAVNAFLECLALSDGVVQDVDFDVNYYLATAYLKMGNPAKAESTFDAILGLRKNEMDAYYLRGVARLEQDNYTGAKEDFDVVIAKYPKDCDKLIDIVDALNQNGYGEIGKDYLNRMLTDYGNRLSDYDLGRVYYFLGEYAQACRYLETAKGEGSADACLYLGKSYEATGDYNYAISVYNDYLVKDTTNASVYNQMGLCKIKMSDYQGALEAFQSAMQIEDNGMMQTLAFNEIVAYEHLGEFKQASVLMENYVRTYPDDSEAAREYEFLKTR
ncbi:MAG: tetratricopeptide repeat protein [Lachnospiraceae bacterium]|nr:tetratricopeptide repeat protein [Lachnospiraceae bacterium]